MGHGEDNIWSLLKDMTPLLIILAFTALVGVIYLRTISTHMKGWKQGRYYRWYQVALIVVLAVYIYRLVFALNRLRGMHF